MPPRRSIAGALFDLGEVFGEQLSPRATRLYLEALEDLPEDELAAAAKILIRNHERYFPTPAEIRRTVVAARPERPALPPPEHRLFAPDNDDRSPEEIIAERELLAPRWAELRRVLTDRGHELAAPRRIAANDDDDGNIRVPRPTAAVIADLRNFRLPDADDPAVQHWLDGGNPPMPANDDPAEIGKEPEA